MERLALIALLTVAVGCSSGTRSALTPDGSPAAAEANRDGGNDVALEPANGSPPSDGPSNAADADPCSPYSGPLGIIRESRLPAGTCDTVASCSVHTRDDLCGVQRQWRCACEAGTWACALIAQSKLDCASRDAGSSDEGLTSPDAAFCCPRDTVRSGCMHLGGIDETGCNAACAFWCSTNWRVETDKYGCERWEMDYRMPAPGENMECLPEGDADGGAGSEAGLGGIDGSSASEVGQRAGRRAQAAVAREALTVDLARARRAVGKALQVRKTAVAAIRAVAGRVRLALA